MRLRLFIAVFMPCTPELRQVMDALVNAGPAVRVIPEAQLHLTLHFLGNTDDTVVNPIVEAMRQTANDIGVFTAKLRGLGAFPSVRRPRIIWTGFEEAQLLERLAVRLHAWLNIAGLAPAQPARPWKAHLTLARVGSGRRTQTQAVAPLLRHMLRTQADVPLGRIKVDAIHLVHSQPGPEGSTYTRLGSAGLSQG
jgi:RNA 2',3'-cyclic 3'-phosphodiesterase